MDSHHEASLSVNMFLVHNTHCCSILFARFYGRACIASDPASFYVPRSIKNTLVRITCPSEKGKTGQESSVFSVGL